MKTQVRMMLEGYMTSKNLWSRTVNKYYKNWRRVRPNIMNYFEFTAEYEKEERYLKDLLAKAKYRRLFATYRPNYITHEVYL